MRDGANTQYAIGAAFLLSVYSDVLDRHHQTVQCGNTKFESSQLMDFAKQQVQQTNPFISLIVSCIHILIKLEIIGSSF